jgi:2-iminobutanoate/2-iminopropanoate deaminase
MRDIVRTEAAPASPYYSQAVKGAGIIFVSGQAGQDPSTGQFAGPSIEEQTHQCLSNVKVILEAAGSSIEKVVSATFILRNPEDFAGMNAVWDTWFHVDPPARQGAQLPVDVPGLLVSIAVIAME